MVKVEVGALCVPRWLPFLALFLGLLHQAWMSMRLPTVDTGPAVWLAFWSLAVQEVRLRR